MLFVAVACFCYPDAFSTDFLSVQLVHFHFPHYSRWIPPPGNACVWSVKHVHAFVDCVQKMGFTGLCRTGCLLSVWDCSGQETTLWLLHKFVWFRLWKKKQKNSTLKSAHQHVSGCSYGPSSPFQIPRLAQRYFHRPAKQFCIVQKASREVEKNLR